jgi:KDO2-lipid IV(A) lauroyltransferase
MLGRAFSYLLIFLLKAISRLPFSVLYLLSDFLYFMLYRVFGYRKSVVRGNLKRSFPDKSEQEIIEIEKKFYHHLCDLIFESIKLFTICEKELTKRFICVNPEHNLEFFKKGISLIGITGHYNNWEMLAISFNLHCSHQGDGIYKKIANPVINEAMIKSRGRFGTILAEMKETSKMFEANKDMVTITGFVADQWPSNIHKCYWTNFLGQETAVSYGAEYYARKYNAAVVFGKTRKIKRGYYAVEYVTIAADTKDFEPGEITKRHTHVLEELIREKPEFWIWSHKRWKRPRPEDVPFETVFS